MKREKKTTGLFIITVILLVSGFIFFNLDSFSKKNAENKTVYVPAYSSIFHSDHKWNYNLSITLSIHNIDLENEIEVTAIDYYNSSGTRIHQYITSKPLKIKPFQTHNLGIKETDIRGGIGANFIVKWHAQSKVNEPIIETIMISTKGQQGISFTSRGVTLK